MFEDIVKAVKTCRAKYNFEEITIVEPTFDCSDYSVTMAGED